MARLPSDTTRATTSPAAERRTRFHHDLEALEADTVDMAVHARVLLERSLQALQTGDLVLCDEVIGADDHIDDAYQRIEQRAVELLGRQQPVASDLRLVVALMHTAIHLERIADMAVNVAEAVRSSPQLDVDHDVLQQLGYMGDTAAAMTRLAVDALARRDTALCERLPQLDEHVDELNRAMIGSVLAASGDARRLEWGLRMFQVSRYLERAGDHAVDIAEQAWYLITGEQRELD